MRNMPYNFCFQIHGQCILYGSTERSSLAVSGYVYKPGAYQSCSYVTTVTAIFCIAYSAGEPYFTALSGENKIYLSLRYTV